MNTRKSHSLPQLPWSIMVLVPRFRKHFDLTCCASSGPPGILYRSAVVASIQKRWMGVSSWDNHISLSKSWGFWMCLRRAFFARTFSQRQRIVCFKWRCVVSECATLLWNWHNPHKLLSIVHANILQLDVPCVRITLVSLVLGCFWCQSSWLWQAKLVLSFLCEGSDVCFGGKARCLRFRSQQYCSRSFPWCFIGSIGRRGVRDVESVKFSWERAHLLGPLAFVASSLW